MASAEEVAAAIAELRAADPDMWVSLDGRYRVSEAAAAKLLNRRPRTLRWWREAGCGPTYVCLPGGAVSYPMDGLLDFLTTYTFTTKKVVGSRRQ